MTERESDGKFGKGNQIAKGHNGKNAGRKPRAIEEDALAALREVATRDDWQKLFRSGFSRAMAGDVAWAKLLLAYGVGLPIQKTEISGPDGNALNINLTWGDYATDDGASPETA